MNDSPKYSLIKPESNSPYGVSNTEESCTNLDGLTSPRNNSLPTFTLDVQNPNSSIQSTFLTPLSTQKKDVN